ncbi:hypothetical protein DPMN_148634 [Dreissena polymorpha]|uniref:Uncharacterized protein n=1 Tax=Dreissena polymorpha TaxID=45954 RepID=A0A9D4FC92_DREPO|nr:hypothetical protein DPMN_148634 [Dreissena polymorpha]
MYGNKTRTHQVQALQVPRSIHPYVQQQDQDPTKYMLYKSLVVSILMYGNKTRTHQVQALQVARSIHHHVRQQDQDPTSTGSTSRS